MGDQNNETNDNGENDQPTNVGVIVGASVGSAAGVGIGTAGLVIFIRRRRLR